MIRQDIQFVRPYFQEVFARAQNFLLKLDSDPKIKEFFTIINQDLAMNDKNFEKIFKSNI